MKSSKVNPRSNAVRYFIVALVLVIAAPLLLYIIVNVLKVEFPFWSIEWAIKALDRNSESYVVVAYRFGDVSANRYTLFVTNYYYLNTGVTVIASTIAGLSLALMKYNIGNIDLNPFLGLCSLFSIVVFGSLSWYLVKVPISGSWTVSFSDSRALRAIYGQELSLAIFSAISGLLGIGGLVSELLLGIIRKSRNWRKR
jgi:hypothetical protein